MSLGIHLLADCPEHVPAIARWHFDEWGARDPDGSVEKWAVGLAERSGRESIPANFVALENGDLLGSAALVEYDMSTRTDLSPWLAGVFVAPEARRRGVATALCEHATAFARELGVPVLYLFTNGAGPLYEGLGWSAIGREPYEGRPVTIMSLQLSRPPG